MIQISVDQYVHNGWSMDYQGLPPADVYLLAEPDAAVPPLLAAVKELRPNPPPLPAPRARRAPPPLSALDTASIIEVPMVATALKEALGDAPATMIRLPLSWGEHLWDFRHPLDFLGTDGGGGIGSGPGMAVGAALALRDTGSGRLPVAMLGDGDFLMGVTALWTAVRNRHPAADRARQQPLVLQRRTAPGAGRARARPAGRKPLDRPVDPRSRHRPRDAGARPGLRRHRPGRGPARRLVAAITEAVAAVRAGKVCVVDVRVAVGYDPGGAAGIFRR